MNFTYKDALRFLDGLQCKGIKPGLKDIAHALAYFGHPQLQFPTVHIAGTNGKGSTAAIVASVLEKAGYKVGLFTSPHLHSVRERIQINRKSILKTDFAQLVAEIKSRLPLSLTYFEFLTLLAFLYFAKKRVDMAVIETGLGGRLDATNLLLPKVSIITNVHLEHQKWLGWSLKDITLEKGGIIKPHVPLITGVNQPQAISLLQTLCCLKHAPFYRLGKDFRYRTQGECFHYYGLEKNFHHLKINLFGPHQIRNASLALGAIEILTRNNFFSIQQTHIRKGLEDVVWPGRFELIKERPHIVLDGAHNPAGARALKNAICQCHFNRLFLILGVMQDKDIKRMVKTLAPLADVAIVTTPNIERAARAEDLEKLAQTYAREVKIAPSVEEAIELALTFAKNDDLVLATGSLYTVAEAREVLKGK
ncbi:MAG: bifunctional folylpolyglutamate synthase/dihydrofolate synthase [Candidatus Desulfofervidaceae bacterium]|nr:bifunctional folylpolyglutamate synthase/dihydrofolate synthase [Candidatus Desulfofervidaceae bacterium]